MKSIKCPQCKSETTQYLDTESYRYIIVCGMCGLKTPLANVAWKNLTKKLRINNNYMGLDIGVANFSFRAGSYSRFSAFRNKLNELSDNPVTDAMGEKMIGKWQARKGIYANANKFKFGALYLHSDCDGYLTPQDAKHLLKDLSELDFTPQKPKSELLADSGTENVCEGWFINQVANWKKACKISIVTGERINFF